MTSPLQPGKDHRITPDQAAEMTKRHRNQATVSGLRLPDEGSLGGVFTKAAVLALLAQQNAEYLRYYYARDGEGKRAIVLVATDTAGTDIADAGASVLDMHWPCPPFCSPGGGTLGG